MNIQIILEVFAFFATGAGKNEEPASVNYIRNSFLFQYQWILSTLIDQREMWCK